MIFFLNKLNRNADGRDSIFYTDSKSLKCVQKSFKFTLQIMVASNLPSLTEHSTVANNDEKIPLLFCHVQTKQKD